MRRPGTVGAISILSNECVVASSFTLYKLQSIKRNATRSQLPWPLGLECMLTSSSDISLSWNRCWFILWLMEMLRDDFSSARVTPSQRKDDNIIGGMVCFTGRRSVNSGMQTMLCNMNTIGRIQISSRITKESSNVTGQPCTSRTVVPWCSTMLMCACVRDSSFGSVMFTTN